MFGRFEMKIIFMAWSKKDSRTVRLFLYIASGILSITKNVLLYLKNPFKLCVKF